MATQFQAKYLVPNLITAASLVLGFLSLIAAAEGHFRRAVVMLFFAGICDLLDGRLARLLDAGTAFGGELDSLCDGSSFGVVPAALVYFAVLRPLGWIGAAVAAIYLCCGIGRLARFNLDKSKKPSFQGIPIPVGAAYMGSFVMLRDQISPWWLALGVVLTAAMMVSTVKVPGFKGGAKSLHWSLLVLCIALCVVFLIWPAAWSWHLWNGFGWSLIGLNYLVVHRHDRRDAATPSSGASAA